MIRNSVVEGFSKSMSIATIALLVGAVHGTVRIPEVGSSYSTLRSPTVDIEV